MGPTRSTPAGDGAAASGRFPLQRSLSYATTVDVLTTRNRPTTSLPPSRGVVGRFRSASRVDPSASQRRPGDGEIILRLAAQRLEDLGLIARSMVLRRLAGENDDLRYRAEGAYDWFRRETPDSERSALLLAASRFVAHSFAQRLR